jgi:hypothetical protein
MLLFGLMRSNLRLEDLKVKKPATNKDEPQKEAYAD